MTSIIQLLPDHVANQIAAGEVVQRPASVVKELMENAVDAKAFDIKLIVKEAGKALIQVIDNGLGMTVTDSRLCFERHATSKIRQAEDLFSLHTKGFRGEALASIAAIAHVELKTKQDQEELGTQLIIEGSKFISQEFAVLPKGTSFSVKNLFFNIPARRNFLKSDTVEHRNIVDEFHRIVLAHPNIHFTYFHNGSELFNLPQSNLRQRIVNVFAGKTNEKLVPVQESTDILTIEGFVSKPEYAKRSRGEQFFFVNNRYIKSGYLHHAVMAAYEGLLPIGAQPSYFIYLEVPPHSIDINIHPTKTEIKFDDEHALYAILRTAIKHSLGQFNVAPILDFHRDSSLDVPYNFKDKESETPIIQVDMAFNPFSPEKTDKSFKSMNSYAKPDTSHWESLYVGLDNFNQKAEHSEGFKFESDAITSTLFDDVEVEKSSNKTYQFQRKYIVNPIKSGLLFVDQNRAHQRILYEQFLTNMTMHQAASQQLLFPLVIAFSQTDYALFAELREALVATGFVFETSSENEISILGLPTNVSESEVISVIDRLMNDLRDGIPENSFSQSDTIAKSMAKTLATKTGVYLNDGAQQNLIDALFACKDPNVSPFQKPVFITLRLEDIDKKFAL